EWDAVLIALHTGMRRGEQFALRWQDVNFPNGVITVPRSKNGERRYIAMSEDVLAIFRTLKSRMKSTWVFPNKTGTGPVEDHNFINRVFAPAVKLAGIPDFHWHDLRHTFASRLVMAGVDLTTVKELMGHKSIGMTLRYSHLSPAHTRQAV